MGKPQARMLQESTIGSELQVARPLGPGTKDRSRLSRPALPSWERTDWAQVLGGVGCVPWVLRWKAGYSVQGTHTHSLLHTHTRCRLPRS